MNRSNHVRRWRLYIWIALVCAILAAVGAAFVTDTGVAARSGAQPGTPGAPYANMPAIARIGVRVDKYLDVPDFAKGPAVDPAKGYRIRCLYLGPVLCDGTESSDRLT